jgi:hypothetical protein
MISLGARKIDKEMLTFLEFSHNNTLGTLIALSMLTINFTWEAQALI